MSTIPDLPTLDEDVSMLSSKFGREIANYFSGSPLNRVGFLRADHPFLRSAFSHPTARFLLLNELSPLVDETQKRLGYVSYADVEGFTGPDPFEKTEEELIKNFNSDEERPLILLLGIDEGNKLKAPSASNVFSYKEFKGRPYFAIDVSPRGKLAPAASKIIDEVKAKGYSFSVNQRQMSLVYGEGELCNPIRAYNYLHSLTDLAFFFFFFFFGQRLCMLRLDQCSTGTRGIPFARSAGQRRCRSMREASGPALPPILLAVSSRSGFPVHHGKVFPTFASQGQTLPSLWPWCQQTEQRSCWAETSAFLHTGTVH